MASTDGDADDDPERDPPAGTDPPGGERDPADSSSPPGPDGLPLLGNTLALVRDPVGFYEDVAAHDADVVRYSVAGTEGHVLKHPDHVERVLVEEPDRYWKGEVANRSVGSIVEGDGLLLAEGDVWRRQRTLLQPAFYRERVEAYADAMVTASEATVDRWGDGDVVSARDAMQQLTLEVLADTLFGVDLDEEGAAVGEAAAAILHRFDAGSLSAYLPAWVPTPRNRRFRRAIDDLDRVVDQLVAERRGDTDGREDLLSLLLAAEEDGETLDDAEVRANMVTFLVAGHETTSLALTYTLYLLATHPGEARRLREELAEFDGAPAPFELPELEHLDRVLREAMRLYPPVYTLFREPKEPVTFEGYELPAGTNLSMPQFIVHRDERFYDDPLQFRPDRWQGGLAEELPDYAYYPFGGGPRHCIGMRFARMEAKLALATLVPRVDLEPVAEDPLDPQMAVTLQPGGPVRMRVDRL
jgi:cytochrome P450